MPAVPPVPSPRRFDTPPSAFAPVLTNGDSILLLLSYILIVASAAVVAAVAWVFAALLAAPPPMTAEAMPPTAERPPPIRAAVGIEIQAIFQIPLPSRSIQT